MQVGSANQVVDFEFHFMPRSFKRQGTRKSGAELAADLAVSDHPARLRSTSANRTHARSDTIRMRPRTQMIALVHNGQFGAAFPLLQIRKIVRCDNFLLSRSAQ